MPVCHCFGVCSSTNGRIVRALLDCFVTFHRDRRRCDEVNRSVRQVRALHSGELQQIAAEDGARREAKEQSTKSLMNTFSLSLSLSLSSITRSVRTCQ